MLSAIRKRLHVSPATAIATLALVFAMTGGAYAAKHYLITSTKQISPKVLKQLQGKTGKAGANGANGANGPAGPTGATGAAGPQGPQGNAGTNGKDGVGVTGAPLAAGEGGCPSGGEAYTSASGTSSVCNGQTGFTKTLPSGDTEKGDWGVSATTAGAGAAASTVSFNIPLSETPSVHLIMANGEEATATGEDKSSVCTGSVASPTAAKGNLCVYTGSQTGVSTNEGLNKFLLQWKWGISITSWPTGEQEAENAPDTANPFGFGARVVASEETTILAGGTWAVTAK